MNFESWAIELYGQIGGIMDDKFILSKKQIISFIEQIQDCLKHEAEIPIPGTYADEFLRSANEYNRIIRNQKVKYGKE